MIPPAGDPDLRRALVDTLPRAVSEHAVTLAFQPIIDLQRSRVAGVEALARWSDRRLGTVPSDTFIPVAEELGLMPTLGLQVLADALSQLAWWRVSGVDLPRVSVNVSPRQLDQPGFALTVVDLVTAHGLMPDDLDLEVSEPALTGLTRVGVAQLRMLAGSGVRIVVDDFRAGLVGPDRLTELPVDSVKLDRPAGRAGSRRAIDKPGALDEVVRSVRARGLHVSAGRVESVTELMTPQTAEFDFVQGYVISRPLEPRRVPGFVRGYAAGAAGGSNPA